MKRRSSDQEERVYRLLWDRLPGSPTLRALLLTGLVIGVVAVLVLVVFPAAERRLPIDQITLRT